MPASVLDMFLERKINESKHKTGSFFMQSKGNSCSNGNLNCYNSSIASYATERQTNNNCNIAPVPVKWQL